MLTISEVLTILEKEGLTKSRQVVLRWIRQGDLPAVQETRKKGFRVDKNDLDKFIARKKAVVEIPESNEQTTEYQAALKELLDKAIVSGSGDLFLFSQQASIPIHLADFKEMAARNFSTGKKMPSTKRRSRIFFTLSDGRHPKMSSMSIRWGTIINWPI